ncbi:MAG: sigma-54 dependent transcriptional regulator [Muribaculaceae bacterium]|nr:sigma-54 dependent transcriptional regulator [Muribaculaceae bacterium]
MKHESPEILVIEDDLTFLTMLSKWMQRKGFATKSATSLASATSLIAKGAEPDLILTDMRLPDGDGIDIITSMSKQGKQIPLMVMTSYAEVQNAVEAMKRGARDYISKPFQPEILLQKINDILLTSNQLPDATTSPVKEAASHPTPRNDNSYLEGDSPAAAELYKMVGLVAPTPMSVMIRGANGTGKEYVARRIHELSKRSSGPFVAIDCGVLSKELSASELFGHVKGAFTGAFADKAGAFERADGGTLFLDEMGNLSYDVQIQLLRAIQERRIRPIGGSKERTVDVRLICATNADLEASIANGVLREDLYHRLNEFTIRVPRLCERGYDIILFAEHFLDEANRDLEKDIRGFSCEARKAMLSYPWEGNLRQLRNVVKRAALLTTGHEITDKELGLEPASMPEPSTLRLNDPDQERHRIISALTTACGNKAKAARILGIDRKTLYNKLRTLAIDA